MYERMFLVLQIIFHIQNDFQAEYGFDAKKSTFLSRLRSRIVAAWRRSTRTVRRLHALQLK